MIPYHCSLQINNGLMLFGIGFRSDVFAKLVGFFEPRSIFFPYSRALYPEILQSPRIEPGVARQGL
jgi:hypothetical protein